MRHPLHAIQLEKDGGIPTFQNIMQIIMELQRDNAEVRQGAKEVQAKQNRLSAAPQAE